jgi:extracellular factor (EF) 3-hydroxypalmitic acid methyl ester biosynthesis protein
MHSNDIDRHIVELVLDWYLIYRDEKNMANFAPGLGEQKLYTDSTGVNLCLEITKPII